MVDRNLELALRIKALVDGADSVEALSEELAALGQDAEQAEAPLSEAGESIERAGKSARESEGAIGKLSAVWQALAGAVVVQQFIEANQNAEALRNTLTALTGSSQKSAEEIQWLTETASRLGVGLGAAGKAYISLAAASKGTQLEGQATRDIFEAVVGALATLGKSSDEAQNALTAVAQMIGKGVVQAEELRGQLEEALPGATQALARALGMTVADLDQLAATGGVVSSDVLPALAAELKKTYGVGSEGATTLTAQLARLQNALTTVFTQIGENGGLTAFKELAIGAAVGVTTLHGALQMTGTALGALAGALVNLDFSQFNATMEEANQKVRAQVAAVAQYSDLIGPAFKQADTAAAGHAQALDGVTTAGQKTADQSTATAGALTKLQFAHQQAREAAELQKTQLDNLANATEAFGKVSQTAAEKTGDYVRQLQLAVTIAAQDEKLKWQQASAASRLAADAQEYYEALKQQVGVMPDVLDAAQKDALAKRAEADAALAAATAAGQQAVAVKAASEVILAQIEQQGISAEEAKRKAAELRAEYEQMRASGAPLSELAAKMNEVVLAEDAARNAAKGYREERAMAAATVAQYKQQLDEAKASGEGVTEAQLRYNTALALYETQLGTALTQLERKNQLQDQGRAADIAAVKAAAELAQARGDEAEATRLQVQAGELAIRQAQDNVTARRAELAVLKEQRDAAEQKALSDRVLTQQEQAYLQALNDGIAAKQNDIKATEASVEAARAQAEAVSQSATAQAAAAQAAQEKAAADRQAAAETQRRAEAERQHAEQVAQLANAAAVFYGTLSQKAAQAWSYWDGLYFAVQGISEPVFEAGNAFDQLAEKVRSNADNMYINLALATASIERAFFAQQKVLTDYAGQLETAGYWMDRLAEQTKAGTVTLQDVALATRAAESELSYLDEQDLDQLRGAIADANDQLRQMQDEAQAAQDRLAELNAEIARERGDTATADRLRLELDQRQALADLEAKLAAAQAANNRDLIALYEAQKRKLQELYELKARNLAQDQQQPPPSAPASAAETSGARATTTNTTTNTFNIHVDGKDLLSEEQVRAKIVPILSRVTRLSA